MGSALKVIHINDPEQQTYRDKALELFNSATFENTLKTKAWSGDFGDKLAPKQTLKALDWIESHDLDFRGHALFWPNWRTAAKIFQETYDNQGKEALGALFLKHIDEISSTTAGRVPEWDALNETRNAS